MGSSVLFITLKNSNTLYLEKNCLDIYSSKPVYHWHDTSPVPGRHVRSPWSLRSSGQGFKSEHKYGSAVGAVYLYPCKTTNPSLPRMYFIEFYLDFEGCRPGTGLLLSLVSMHPRDSPCEPPGLRICHPETGLASSLKKWTPFNLSKIYCFKW